MAIHSKVPCPQCQGDTQRIWSRGTSQARTCPACSLRFEGHWEFVVHTKVPHSARNNHKPAAAPIPIPEPHLHPLWLTLTEYERGAVVLYLDPTITNYPHGTIALARSVLARLGLLDPTPPKD